MADTRSPLDLPVLLGEGAALPEYGSASAAGADLRASEAVVIGPGARAAVSTGLRLAIPEGHAGLVWPRSGLAVRHGIDTLAGVIDSDYRGEVKVVLVNLGQEPYEGAPGDRIAQLLLVPCLTPEVRTVDELPPSHDGRGDAGFGSSGR